MQSQSPNIQKAEKVENQAKSSVSENISKSAHHQNGTMKKQNMHITPSTTGSTAGKRIQTSPMIPNNPQQISNYHQTTLVSYPSYPPDHSYFANLTIPQMGIPRVSPNNRRYENNDEAFMFYKQCFPTQQHGKRNTQTPPNGNAVNRQNAPANRQGNQNNPNKKSGTSTITISRHGSNSSLSDKKYNSNNNNSDKNNNSEYKNGNKSASHQHNQQPLGIHKLNNSIKKNPTSTLIDTCPSSLSTTLLTEQTPKKRDSRTAHNAYDLPWYTEPHRGMRHIDNSYRYIQSDRGGMAHYQSMCVMPYSVQNDYEVSKQYRNNNTQSVQRNKVKQNRNNKYINTNHYAQIDRYLSNLPHVEVKEPPISLINNSIWDQLSSQVWKKFMVNQQNHDSFNSKMLLWVNLRDVIQGEYPYLYPQVVGSTLSGFGCNGSDVDICLVVNEIGWRNFYANGDMRTNSQAVLGRIKEIIDMKVTMYGNSELINAKVPILRFFDNFHKCEVDLNFNNSVGIQNTQLLFYYTQLDWRLRPLGLVIKLWAQFHKINSAKEMTISSYSLVLMVINFLQCGVSPPVLPCLHNAYPKVFKQIQDMDMHLDLKPYFSTNTQPLGELFLQFFNYYSHFNFASNAISVRAGCVVPIEDCRQYVSYKNDPNQWTELCIEEPFDRTNTAHSCYDAERFACIKRVFAMSYEALNRTKDLNSIFDKPFLPSSAPLL